MAGTNTGQKLSMNIRKHVEEVALTVAERFEALSLIGNWYAV